MLTFSTVCRSTFENSCCEVATARTSYKSLGKTLAFARAALEEEEEEEEIFIYTGSYLQFELFFKAALLKQINITYIHKEKQHSDMRHTIKVHKE